MGKKAEFYPSRRNSNFFSSLVEFKVEHHRQQQQKKAAATVYIQLLLLKKRNRKIHKNL